MWMNLGPALLELLAPETCLLCGRRREPGCAWTRRGPRAHGLRLWDEPHMCGDCVRAWRGAVHRGRIGVRPLISPLRADRQVAEVVAWWKYRGIRGLGWPLAACLAPAIELAAHAGGAHWVVPVPLHPRRRRERGFDQVRQLVELCVAGRGASGPEMRVRRDVVRRQRATAQQASLDALADDRLANVGGAFEAVAPVDDRRRVVLVDDLATTGATMIAVADALTLAGWSVTALVAVAQAPRLLTGEGLDTTAGRSQAVASKEAGGEAAATSPSLEES